MNLIKKLGSLEKITLRFVVFSLLFFGLSSLEGMMMRTELCNIKLIEPEHYFAVLNAHPIVGVFGYSFMLVMGAFYFLVPTLMNKKLFSEKLAHLNLWLMVGGVMIVWLSSFLFRYAALYTNYWPLPILRSTPVSLLSYGIGMFTIMSSVLIFCFNLYATILKKVPGQTKPTTAYIISGLGLDGLINLFRRLVGKGKRKDLPDVPLPLTAIFKGSVDTVLDALVLGLVSLVLIIYAVSGFAGKMFSHKIIDPLIYKNVYWWGLDLIADGLVLIYVVGTWYLLTMLITKRSIFGENVVRAAMFIELVVSWSVWSHHLLSDQPQPLFLRFFSGELITSLEIITTGIAIFCSLATLWLARPLKMTVPLKFMLGGITGFAIGAVAGIMQANVDTNRILHNTQWVVGFHAHTMILVGLSMTLFAALYAVFPMVTKLELKSNRLVSLHFWCNFIGGIGMSMAMGYAGLAGMLRRNLYFGETKYLPYMYVAMLFGLVIVVGYAAMMINIIRSIGVKTLISLFVRIPALEKEV
jgi:cytochrome c oxidase subunit 1